MCSETLFLVATSSLLLHRDDPLLKEDLAAAVWVTVMQPCVISLSLHAPQTHTHPLTARTHLRRFVPHVGTVLVLAVVLRPGTCQVGASERALWGPQLDAMAGGGEENEERSAQRERGGGRRRRTTERRPLMQSEEQREESRWGRSGWRCKQVICQQHVVNTTTNQQTHSWPAGLACLALPV